MRNFCISSALMMSAASGYAANIVFATDPFAGSTALTTPGRQVVGNELFTSFSVATDTFFFDPTVFNITQLLFANNIITNIPTSGVNVIVLRTFDDDNNTATAFGAGSAANLIASQITTPGAGFFIYFNQTLDLPRLVYSTNLDDNTADLRILARLTNLTGQAGRDALINFTSADFAFTPEPSSFMLGGCGALLLALRKRMRRP